MVIYREVEVWILAFLFSAIDRVDYSNTPSRFIPGDRARFPRDGRQTGTPSRLKYCGREKIFAAIWNCRHIAFHTASNAVTVVTELSGSNRHVQEVQLIKLLFNLGLAGEAFGSLLCCQAF